jgi:hypothetical protein
MPGIRRAIIAARLYSVVYNAVIIPYNMANEKRYRRAADKGKRAAARRLYTGKGQKINGRNQNT